MERLVNDVYLSGVIHFLKGESHGESRLGKYVEFSLKRQFKDTDGCDRIDYLRMRVFDEELGRWVEAQEEGTPVWVAGELRSSLGSGRIYVLVNRIQKLNTL